MSSISLCMIVKDEAFVLNRCLDSVLGVVDEIIIVDTGSKDMTKEIAMKYSDKIYDFEWIDDFSAARNFSFDKASKDYILWLDADEYLTDESREKLKFLKSSICEEIDVISLQTYMQVDENNNPSIICKRNRIVKRERNFRWVGFVHEYIDVYGTICESSIYIIHDKVKQCDSRNLNIYKENLDRGNKLTDRDIYYYGKELYCNELWDESIEILEIFIKKDVCIEEIIDALCKIGKCYDCKNQKSKAREYYFKTFEYGEPKIEALYNIANSFESECKYKQAIKWYEIILGLDIYGDCRQCLNLTYWRFRPHLNLCVCYYEIGNIKKSYYHHIKSKEINPLDQSIIKNDTFFEKLKSESNIQLD